MSRDQYINKIKPYAKKASNALDIPVEVILGQWAHETAWGSSDLVNRANNHAGIKSNSRGADYKSGVYAGYKSMDSFTNDYIRTMKLSYYDGVRKAGNVSDTVDALHQSPWATDSKYGLKVANIIKGMGDVKLEDINVMSKVTEQTKDLSQDELTKYATVGLGFALLIGLLND